MRFGLLVCAIALFVAGPVEAQEGSLGLELVRIEGPGGVRDTTEEIVNGVNIADCAAAEDTVLTVKADQNPMNAYDLWVANTDDCESVAARAGTTQFCFDIGREISQLGVNETFTITLSELQVGPRDPCMEVTSPNGGFFYLHVFDSASSSTTGELGSIPRDVLPIPVDVRAPAAPEMTSGDLSGQAVSVTWNAGEGDTDFQQYRYELFNLGSCGGGGSDASTGGDGGTGGGTTPFATVSGGGASATVRPVELGLGVGEGALIAVIAVDPADNRSGLSDTVCVTNQPSAGFCAVYGEMGGECSTCSVATPGSAASGTMAGLAGFFAVLGLVVFRGRRRERSRRFRA
jgi:hypothetical protein